MTRESSSASRSKSLSVLKKLSLTVAWAAVALTLFVVATLTSVVKVLAPERLTPLVERYASSYLDADVTASRIELTFWHTFPRLTLDVDSLSIVSRSLKPLTDAERAALPADADSLMSIGCFNASVNIARLALGEIRLYDVVVGRPKVNLVCVNDSVANYNIVPPSEEEDTTALEIPDFSIDRFALTDCLPITYTSIADSIQGTVYLKRAELKGTDAPAYTVELGGDLTSPMLSRFNFSRLALGLDGTIRWRRETPSQVDVTGLLVAVDEINAHIDTQVDFADELTLNTFNLKLDPLDVMELTGHCPAEYAKMVRPLSTDMKVNLSATLTRPYCPADTTVMPSFKATVSIPECRVTYGKASLDKVAMDTDIDFDGNDMDRSTVEVKRLILQGPATSIKASGKATTLLTDPAFDCKLEAATTLHKLPPELRALIPGNIAGRIDADLAIKGRQSYVTHGHYHDMYVKGSLTANDLDIDMPDDSISAWIRKLTVEFGSNNSFVKDDQKVDSLLTLSFKVDTAAIDAMGYKINLSTLAAGAGTANRHASADTTAINPFGGKISVKRLNILSTIDSTRLRLREVTCQGSLRRYEGNAKAPEIALALTAKRISAGDPTSRYTLRDGDITFAAHLNTKKTTAGKKTQAIRDSLAAIYPNLPADSIASMARTIRSRQKSKKANDGSESIDFGLDNSVKELLRRWGAHGTIKAKRGRVFTPYFPLRNNLTNIDVEFSNDSLVFRNVGYKVGQSDFVINGSISNLSRALTSRSGRQPIKINFNLESDTINVNEIVRAIFAGGAYADRVAAGQAGANTFGDLDDDSSLDKAVTSTSDTVTGPLIVPRNIEASLKVKARHIIYADLALRRFRGTVNIYDGAINLDRLSARSDIGGIDMTALYSAPDRDNMEFGFGMQVKDFHLDRFLNLFPAIDTIMPMLSGISGIVNAEIAATSNVDTLMNLDIPSMRAALKIEGDSLVLLDSDTFKTISKWLLFKNKNRNMIDKMSVEMVVENSQVELFPFMFDMDRYRLGVMGHNDMALNYDYHVSVLKSPLPFKFGINIKGTPDKMKVRLGGAKFKENMAVEKRAIVDTTRVNLMKQISNVFRKGVTAARLGKLDLKSASNKTQIDALPDTISHADSLLMIKEGLIEAPKITVDSLPTTTTATKSKRKNKR